MSDKKVTIEGDKKLSESILWALQREYFDKSGINAWVSQVPFYITSNPFIARCYAKLFFAFILDWSSQNPKSKSHPFYILELGTGSGRFSYYFVKALSELMSTLNTNDINFCYVMSDFTTNNIEFWDNHPALKPFIDKGLIDFALYNMEESKPIKLIKKNITLDKKSLVNPLTVFANYIFDTITHDAFTMRDKHLHELLFSVNTDESNMVASKPAVLEELRVDYSLNKIDTDYYKDKVLDAILKQYKESLVDTSFLFPIGSLKALKFLQELSDNKLLVIATDKGYNSIDSLENLSYPAVSFHGSFSMMVNFHAIAEYFKATGGDASLQEARMGIKTSVFASGFKFSELKKLSFAIEEQVQGFSPGDYFVLHTRISDSFKECSIPTIAAHMQLALWDPHIYLKLSSHIISKIADEDKDTISFMASMMPKMAENYYFMPQSQSVLFDIGIFFHTIKNFEQAIIYYEKAEAYVGDQSSLHYNLGLCKHQLGFNAEALDSFKKALDLDSDSKEAVQWIEYIEGLS